MAAILAARTTLFSVVLAALCFSSVPARADDASDIRRLIGKTWDKPNSKVVTDPIVIVDNYAIASWTQGAHGGRALLNRDGGHWRVVLCSGDPLKEAVSIASVGVPADVAQRLASELAAQEATASAERRALFSTFDGIVLMDEPSHQQSKQKGHAP
ncbi:MAG: hypothetical protein CTY31_07865 [Hyphomicrobium sp.]|nr:MAG: hypothetical protein CTY39_01540 [Hyphomicrobium sp.]PPC99809.1 MAG: hypothetical protein CTY31_07865 [Hyphomicrobium sp.]